MGVEHRSDIKKIFKMQLIYFTIMVSLSNTKSPLPSRWKSFLMLFPGPDYDKIVLERDSRQGYWQFPGGSSDASDRSSSNPIFKTMKREFKEETGANLPWLTSQEKFELENNYYFYVAKSDTHNLPLNNKLNGDGEVDEWGLFTMAEVDNLEMRRSSKRALDKAVANRIIDGTSGLADCSKGNTCCCA